MCIPVAADTTTMPDFLLLALLAGIALLLLGSGLLNTVVALRGSLEFIGDILLGLHFYIDPKVFLESLAELNQWAVPTIVANLQRKTRDKC